MGLEKKKIKNKNLPLGTEIVLGKASLNITSLLFAGLFAWLRHLLPIMEFLWFIKFLCSKEKKMDSFSILKLAMNQKLAKYQLRNLMRFLDSFWKWEIEMELPRILYKWQNSNSLFYPQTRIFRIFLLN